jgi:hypothetical protein
MMKPIALEKTTTTVKVIIRRKDERGLGEEGAEAVDNDFFSWTWAATEDFGVRKRML